jgi:hypothetical protein
MGNMGGDPFFDDGRDRGSPLHLLNVFVAFLLSLLSEDLVHSISVFVPLFVGLSPNALVPPHDLPPCVWTGVVVSVTPIIISITSKNAKLLNVWEHLSNVLSNLIRLALNEVLERDSKFLDQKFLSGRDGLDRLEVKVRIVETVDDRGCTYEQVLIGVFDVQEETVSL